MKVEVAISHWKQLTIIIMMSFSTSDGETRSGLAFPTQTTIKLDTIYKSTVFRHWTTGNTEVCFLTEDKHMRQNPQFLKLSDSEYFQDWHELKN